jgi:hypothetical protein
MRPQTSSINPNIRTLSIGFVLLLVGILMATLIATGDPVISTIVVSVPLILGLSVLIFNNPYYGIIAYLNYSFFANGLKRYIPAIPLGLGVDFILLLTIFSLFINIKWKDTAKLKQGIFYLTVLWTVYTIFLIVNPELGTVKSLFYAIRGVSLYSVQVIPLVFLYMDSKKEFNNFLKLIISWSIISTVWGLKQIIIGTDAFEQRWLDDGGNITHVLNGQLRAFSFYSDAGQFGATMAFVSFLTFILGFGPYKRKVRFTYLAIAFFTFIGFSISGSRGPVFILIFGFLFYLILIKQFKTLIIGLVIGIIAFSFLRFTNIGSGNYQVFRIRTALDPKEASLMVRLQNQQVISKYLENKPFGAGIGSTDVFGIRFYPGSILATLPTDSWFVSIWAQSGIVGLVIHLLGLAYVLVAGFEKIYRLKSKDLRVKMIALYGGFLGIIIASLANPIFGQAPMGAIMYICMVYLTIADKLDLEFVADEKKEIEDNNLKIAA